VSRQYRVVTDASSSDEAVALFGEAPETFIAARDALARRLQEEGRRDDAATVKALRKPTVPAWALNQLARRDPKGVEALLETGAELRAAQQAALSSGRAPDRLRAASVARREAVDELVRTASNVLTEAGRAPGPHLDAIRTGLEAASVNAAAGEDLRKGTFERPPSEGPGFGDVFGLTSVTGGGEDVDEDVPTKAEIAKLRREHQAVVRRAGKERDRADALARERGQLETRLEELRAKHLEAERQAKAAELEARRAEAALSRATPRSVR
jgi:hypothetical protein